MYIKRDYNFNDLKEMVWSGAIETINTIEEHGKENELMQFLEFGFIGTPTETDINDFLWFNSDEVFKELGIIEEEEGEDNE